jgi:hypothetical protein
MVRIGGHNEQSKKRMRRRRRERKKERIDDLLGWTASRILIP